MNIYLIKDGKNAGPYSDSEVMARVKDGRYAKNDLAWCEGYEAPVPLIEILCEALPTQPLPASDGFSPEELRIVADNYPKLFIAAACWLIFCFLPVSGLLEHVCYLLIFGSWIRFGWRLSGA